MKVGDQRIDCLKPVARRNVDTCPVSARVDNALFVGYGAMLVEGFLSTLVVISIAGFGFFALGDKLMATPALGRFVQSFAKMVSMNIPFLSFNFMTLFAAVWVSTFALTTLDTTNRLGRYIIQEMALPLKEKSPGAYKVFSNKWVASIVIAFTGLFLARSGGYTILWPAFSGANQLLASVVMLTVTIWVKKKLDPKYTMTVFIPGIILWVTVTAALVWYLFAVVPTMLPSIKIVEPFPGLVDGKGWGMVMLKGFDFQKNLTGFVVGLITLFMLILNFIMIGGFAKNWKTKAQAA